MTRIEITPSELTQLEDAYEFLCDTIEESPYVPTHEQTDELDMLAQELRKAYAAAGTPDIDRIAL